MRGALGPTVGADNEGGSRGSRRLALNAMSRGAASRFC